jgi:enoyl-[acyl-carrier protein] reductase I
VLLQDKKLLITGVLTDDSIAFGVAKLAQEQGAEIALTSFGRVMRLTERVSRKLPNPDVEILELDVQDPSHGPALTAALEAKWGRLDGVQ